MGQNTTNQPGVLGFCWVPIVAGAIDTPNQILTGVVASVSRVSAGRYAIDLRDPNDLSARIDWPYGFSIVPVSDTPLIPSLSGGVLSSNMELHLFAPDGTPTDPTSTGDAGFTFNVLPT